MHDNLCVQQYALRGNAAPTAAQLISAVAAVIAALASNPHLRSNGVNAILDGSGGGATARFRGTLCDGRGQPLREPIEVTVGDVATATCDNADPVLTLTGSDSTTFIFTPGANGAFALTITFGGAATYPVAIRLPYVALPVASVISAA